MATSLVTGASRGIGRAVALALARDGHDVAVGYASARRRRATPSRTRSGRSGAGAVGAGPTSPTRPPPTRSSTRVEASLGPVEILVANAGVNTPGRRVEEIPLEEWDRLHAVNLRAPFLLARRVLPGMIERGFGRIVLLSSVAAYTGGIIGAHYASSKAGLHGLAHSLSQQAAGAGVTVNVVAPALIESEMLPADPAARERLAASLPVGRLGHAGGGRRPHRRGRAQRLPHEPVDPRRRRSAPDVDAVRRCGAPAPRGPAPARRARRVTTTPRAGRRRSRAASAAGRRRRTVARRPAAIAYGARREAAAAMAERDASGAVRAGRARERRPRRSRPGRGGAVAAPSVTRAAAAGDGPGRRICTAPGCGPEPAASTTSTRSVRAAVSPVASVAVTVALCVPGTVHVFADPLRPSRSSRRRTSRRGDRVAVGVGRAREEARGRAGGDADESRRRDELRRGGGAGGGRGEDERQSARRRGAEQAGSHVPPSSAGPAPALYLSRRYDAVFAQDCDANPPLFVA